MPVLKVCRKCGAVWNSVEQFLSSNEIVPLGFQAHFSDGDKSVLLFQHNTLGCNTTLALPVGEFSGLIPGYDRTPNAFQSPSCRGICLTNNQLKPCDHPNCRNALVRGFVRKLLQEKQGAIE